jgi:hypothetical protein
MSDGSIVTDYKKIQKLNYGRNGFLAFLDKLFMKLEQYEMQSFNYYFALKRLLDMQQDYKDDQ